MPITVEEMYESIKKEYTQEDADKFRGQFPSEIKYITFTTAIHTLDKILLGDRRPVFLGPMIIDSDGRADGELIYRV